MGMAAKARRCGRRLRAAEATMLTGSTSLPLARELVRQIIEALGLPEGLSRREAHEREAAAKAALAGLQPQGTLEGMMAGQMIATHAAAMACLTRAMDPDTAETDAQAALRRAERLLAVYARQCDSLLRARHARPDVGAKGGKEGLVIEGVAFEPPPWMEMLSEEARSWLNGQLTGAVRLVKRAPEPKRLEAKALPADG
jgi:hypothetical protein